MYRWTQDSIGNSIGNLAKGLLVVLPLKSNSKISFEWRINEEPEDGNEYNFDGFYSEKPGDLFHLEYFPLEDNRTKGDFAVVASLEDKYEVSLGIRLRGVFESMETNQCEDGCECLSADAFEVLSDGRLRKLDR